MFIYVRLSERLREISLGEDQLECGSSGARTDTLAGRSITGLTKPCHCVDLGDKTGSEPGFLRLTLRTYQSYGLARCLTMHTNSPAASNIHRRRFFSFLIACLFSAPLAPSFQSEQTDAAVLPKVGVTTTRKAPKSPAYDCAGDIQHFSIEGNKLIEEAIDEAQTLLEKCESCWRMFGDDREYAINRLKRMRRDQAIIISAEVPVLFKLSSNGKRLKVYESQKLADDSAAATQDVADAQARSKSPDMVKPCIYINPKEFIVIKDKDAGRFALFNLAPKTQRALAILHELGHVTRVIADDDEKTKNGQDQSMASTDCIRRNCVESEVFECPGAPPRRSTQP